jgi:hypothetical protein
MGRKLSAAVCGSFHRGLVEVQHTVAHLQDAGVKVLSPADPRVVDSFGDFLYVASDRLRNIRVVQNRHFAAVETADFVWLVAPDGYVGLSAAMEIGTAFTCGTPVYTDTAPTDLSVRQYVTIVGSVDEVVRRMRGSTGPDAPALVLLEPTAAVDAAHRHLEAVQGVLLRQSTEGLSPVHAHADRVRAALRHL